jgi:hypothetical protein
MPTLTAEAAYLAGREDLKRACLSAELQLAHNKCAPRDFQDVVAAELATLWAVRIHDGELPSLSEKEQV